jgi:hypothetical protein
MTVSLQGSSPAVLTAGILLMSRARSFGRRLPVEIVGSETDITAVHGPALVHSPVLASCGVGRKLGSGALVIVPGPPAAPLATTLAADGTSGWFQIDRAGGGIHPVSQAFVNLCRDPRRPARDLGRRLRRLLAELGCPPEPALLDLLFQAPAPPLTRLGVALRAGRSIDRGSSPPLTRHLAPTSMVYPDPLPDDLTWDDLVRARTDGVLDVLMDRLRLPVRVAFDEWLDDLAALEGGPQDYSILATHFAVVASHLVGLPVAGMLPPLSPAVDAVGVGLSAALGAAELPFDATRPMVDTFRFLGGRFTEAARYPIVLDDAPPPADRLDRWQWLCAGARTAADQADPLWRRVTDMES